MAGYLLHLILIEKYLVYYAAVKESACLNLMMKKDFV